MDRIDYIQKGEPSWIKWLAVAIAFGIVMFMLAATADACTSCDKVKSSIQNILKGTPVNAVRKAPGMKGLYEVQMGKTIAYTDRQGKFFIVGHMYDPAHNRDLTAERLADINRIAWKDLPLKDAIIAGPKDGVKLAIFTDPECPYCKHLETMLKGMDGIRTYTFLFPLESIHPAARAKAESIWCAKHRHKAMLSVMLDEKQLPAGKCNTSAIDRNIQLAQKLGINGTPGLISKAGRIMAGAPQSQGALLAWMMKK